ncbi:hypothetical protein CPB84DRAFT_1798711 [Gymnopilus junonius]|uniref:DUF6534 domain-containing protein n=1 Tax=Gymnopilus junonius TaxID=109634 RepID=A0A9P5NAG8_GYMJU|nr:hypothetical protein CPB84DRAFT_1798711 [Gymnopilus junonius]
MDPVPPIPPDLVGYLLHWGLFGSLSTQVYLYFLAFPNDPRWTQMLVYGLYAAELIQTVLLTQTAFFSFAAGFGNLNAINEEGNLWFSVPILSSAIASVVQVFYAYRIQILAQSYIVPSIIVLVSFVFRSTAGGIATGIIAHQSRVFTDFLGTRVYIATGLWNGGSALCDVIIAAGMTYYLSKKKTSWKQTRRIVQKLIRLIIETGTLTATIAIINLILSLLPGKPNYFQTTSGILGKMYSTTMMVVFNNRTKIVGGEHSSEYMSDSDGTRTANPPPGFGALGRVVVTQEQYTYPLDDWNPGSKKAEEARAPRDA